MLSETPTTAAIINVTLKRQYGTLQSMASE